MAVNNDVYQIRLSRLPLFILFLFGAGFLFVGLELSVLHILFPGFTVAPDKTTVFYVFLVFVIGVGGLTTIQMFLYLILPPVMYRVSSEGISFGTGLRYKLFTIPWKHVDTIGGGIDLTVLVANKKIVGGLQIKFKESEEIPGLLATSIGVYYMFYIMTLSYWYMSRPIKEAISQTTEMQKKFAGV